MNDLHISDFFTEQLSKIDDASRQSLQQKADRAAQVIARHKNIFIAFAVIYLLISAVTLVFIFLFLRDRQAFLTEKLANHKWSMASTLYAEPPVIRRGDSVNAEWLVNYLERLKYQRTPTSLVKTSQYHTIGNEVLFQKNTFPNDTEENFPVQVNFQGNKIISLSNSQSHKQIMAYELEPVAISNLFASQYEKRTLVTYEELPP